MKTSAVSAPIIAAVPDNLQTSPRRENLSAKPFAQPFKFRWFDLMTNDASLTLVQVRLLNKLFAVADLDGGKIYWSRTTLADHLGVNFQTIGANLRKLEAKGWIVCVERGSGQRGKNSTYQLVIPPRLLLPATIKR